LRRAWLDARDLDAQRRLAAELTDAGLADVPFIPMGSEYWQATAYRKKLTGVTVGCFATSYGVRRV
jgi:peptide/nickel transport system substrate-binding protein